MGGFPLRTFFEGWHPPCGEICRVYLLYLLVVILSCVIDERLDGHTVVQVEAEGVYGVVHYHYILLLPVEEHVQVLHVPGPPHLVLEYYAVLSIEPLCN